MSLLADLTADLRHMTGTWDGGPLRIWISAIPRIALQGRFRTVLYFRLSHALWRRRATRPIALWFQSRGQRASGAEIHPAATIGAGFNLTHGGAVVIGHEVVAGRDLVVYQSVTIGHGRGQGQAILGHRVRIFAGVSVLGPVRVGDDAVLAAHALVLADVPPQSVVRGVWRGASVNHQEP